MSLEGPYKCCDDCLHFHIHRHTTPCNNMYCMEYKMAILNQQIDEDQERRNQRVQSSKK